MSLLRGSCGRRCWQWQIAVTNLKHKIALQADRLPNIHIKDAANHRAPPTGKPDIVVQLPGFAANPTTSTGRSLSLKPRDLPSRDSKEITKLERPATPEALPAEGWREKVKLERQTTLEQQTSTSELVKKEEPGETKGISVKVETRPIFGARDASWGSSRSEHLKLEAERQEAPLWMGQSQADIAADASSAQRDITQYLAGRASSCFD